MLLFSCKFWLWRSVHASFQKTEVGRSPTKSIHNNLKSPEHRTTTYPSSRTLQYTYTRHLKPQYTKSPSRPNFRIVLEALRNLFFVELSIHSRSAIGATIWRQWTIRNELCPNNRIDHFCVNREHIGKAANSKHWQSKYYRLPTRPGLTVCGNRSWSPKEAPTITTQSWNTPI